ncbi:Na+/H+ antiporter [Bosea sp. (in: a-proteobacteria)]|jgi:CPA1 family monovalent cation:H+ antiporter|uniref:Na+/H+ antiporter n=1 Tax=Bosea sp. (in: a-proteobacteria) TaxID=1871050 RepID=UPI002DDD81F3|nr:Na+/H+ antiporter [Bosea sp. (in: a-proteobacteria)]HEV2512226.1 Na+/H+ antiporter [Bosea sp. (in: a-proteobacteria)]
MQIFTFILILVMAVVASQPLTRLLRIIPLPIVQIALGAALAWPTAGFHRHIEPELFLLLFIAPLLFADAWEAPKREYRKLLRPILSLAIGLVFFTTLFGGLALHWLVPAMPLPVAFALAAVLSPTDAVAVSAIVDKETVPKNLMHVLEGESLLNDATGLVIFRFATIAALTGSFSLWQASLAFLFAVAGGIAAGLLAVVLVSWVLKLLAKFDRIAPEAQVLVIMFLPFAAFLAAEAIHASGVLAAVVAGFTVGRTRTANQLSVSAYMLAHSFWTMLAFLLNGAIFVLLGLQLPAIIRTVPPALIDTHWLWQPLGIIIALTLCLIVLRYSWISIALGLGRLVSRLLHLPVIQANARVRLAGSIAGVRGAVTLAGVLSLPVFALDGSPFPGRDVAIFLAAGVILLWLAIASLGLPPIVRGLAAGHGAAQAIELRRARIAATEAAITRLEGVAHRGGTDGAATVDQAVAEGLIATYRRRLALLDDGKTPREEAVALQRSESTLRQTALAAEREALRGLLRSGEIDDTTFNALAHELVLHDVLAESKAGSH